jgi:hypothetical protein
MIDLTEVHPQVAKALREAGWYPGRRAEVEKWAPLTDEGYVFHVMAREILTSLDDLTIVPLNEHGPNFFNGDPFVVDPFHGSGSREIAVDVEEILGGEYFPLGSWMSRATVFVDQSGRVAAAGVGPIWDLGATFEEALELIVRSQRPLVEVGRQRHT